MSTPTSTEAQRRADQISGFRAELERLTAEGLVLAEQPPWPAIAAHHDRLLAGYAQAFDIDADARAHKLSLGMRVASFLGALAMAASVFYLFYQFWGLFTELQQAAILLTASLASLGLTAWLSGRRGAAYFTKLAALVAFACFVLNLTMLGQAFNITPTDKALLPWAALAFVLAYACDLRLMLAAGIACLAGYVAARVGEFGGLYWITGGPRPENFFPMAALLLAIPAVFSQQRHAGFAALYRVGGWLCLLVPMLMLSHWGVASHLDADPRFVEGAYQVAGFVASAAAIAWGARQGWPETTTTGIAFFVIFLYSKFFDWWWAVLPKWLFFLVLSLSAVLILWVLMRVRARGVLR